MMDIGRLGPTQTSGTLPQRQPAPEGKQPLSNEEIQKLTADIEKEESELKRINQEFSQYLSDGAQDMTKLKSAEMTQKQMQIQSMRLQISKLENPGESGEAARSAAKDGMHSGREKFDRYIPSGGEPKETPGLYRLETDEDGNQTVVFDRAEREKEPARAGGRTGAPADAAKAQQPAAAGAKAGDALPGVAAPGKDDKKPQPEDGPKKKAEVGKSVGDDSQWKAEIDKIKQKKSQLSREIGGAHGDENKRRELQARLAQVEAELSAKDTESYRKQRIVVRYLGSEMTDAADTVK